jgi:zinc transport system substrate-binding protein
MSRIMSDADTSESWARRLGWPLARLAGVALGIGAGTLLLGAAIAAVFGSAPDLSGTLREPLAGSAPSTPHLDCFAGIPPVAWLVERIGRPWVQVETLVRPGQDPHSFAPTPRQAIQLGKARLFFRAGVPFEDRLIEQIAAGPAPFTVVNTASGIVRRASSDADEEGQADPHVWLSPPLLKIMAANIAAALCKADSRHADDYQANVKTLCGDLDTLDRRVAKSLVPYRGQAFYVFHPAFAYFADRYSLRQESVEVDGKPPTPRQIFALIQKARQEGVKIIFLQPQFNPQIASSVAQAIGGTVLPMDDLAFDVTANLDDVAQKIAASREQAK